ncbi:MAG: hypothetical protein AB1563_14380 [Bacillota bacterium]
MNRILVPSGHHPAGWVTRVTMGWIAVDCITEAETTLAYYENSRRCHFHPFDGGGRRVAW